MRRKYILIFLVISLSQIACPNKNRVLLGRVENRYTSFGVIPPPIPWQQKYFPGADLYFENKDKNASIFINSQCQKIDDSPLEALLAQELIGLTNIEVQKEERLMIAGREAIVSQIKAKLDGVPRSIKIMILKKNRCVYDAVFSAPLSSKNLEADFDRMIKTMWAEAEL